MTFSERHLQHCRNIQAQPPSTEVCHCVTDDNATRLIEHLKFMSNVMRHFGNQTAVNEFYKSFYGDESDDQTGLVKHLLMTNFNELKEYLVGIV